MQPKAKPIGRRYSRQNLRVRQPVVGRIEIAPDVSYCDAELENQDALPWSTQSVEKAYQEEMHTMRMLATWGLIVIAGLACFAGAVVWRLLH